MRNPSSPLLFLTLSFSVASAASPPLDAFAVTWLTRTPEPGRTVAGRPTYQGAMPLGNGALTALAWPNVTSGGVSLYIGHQSAQSSHTELFKLPLLEVVFSPNPFTLGSFFNQTLDISTGSVLIYAGGTSRADYALLVNIYVDALSDTLTLDATSRVPTTLFSLSATLTSTRPATTWTYKPPFATCSPISSQPDVFVDPLPTAMTLSPLAPATDAFRHASDALRPSRTLLSSGALSPGSRVAFAPATLIAFHRNVDADGLTLNATLSQQGCGSLVSSTPDWWRDNTFGLALDGDNGAGTGALTRSSPASLVSAVPAASFSLRATVVAVQTNTVADWLTDLAARVTTNDAAPPATRRAASDAWWASFWGRSWVAVNATGFSDAAVAAREAEERLMSARDYAVRAAALPVAGASLWLRASDLSGGNKNNTAVSAWVDASGSGISLTQSVAAKQPIFVSNGLGVGQDGVRFDGVNTFVFSAAAQLPAHSTIFAVFRDDGSSGGDEGFVCCSGVVYFAGGNAGVSTVPATTNTDDDDAFPAPAGVTPIVAMVDWSGSNTVGSLNLAGRTVQATAVYSASGSSLRVDGCAQASSGSGAGASHGVYVGTRNNEHGRFFKGVIGEVIAFPRTLNASEIAAVEAYLEAAWPAMPKKAKCKAAKDDGFTLSRMYAITRYTQAIQSRGTLWPIKFNGMAFIAVVNDGSGTANYRDWGPSNWWQNTRLPYGAMLIAGDTDTMKVILDYYANILVFLAQRTQLYYNHSGMWTTETHHLSGAYDMSDYGCDSHAGWPVSLMKSGYLHVDQGGDSGTGEYSLMALDYLTWTGSAQYLPIAFAAADYFMGHFVNVPRNEGRVVVFPAQVLETWWCAWDVTSQSFTNCCADDSPTISGMMTLFEKLLALPDTLTTPTQRAAWTAFTTVMPLLPVSGDGSIIAPARLLSTGTHNSEGPELYAMHPHRVFTKGREVATGFNISLGVRTHLASSWARGNSGWNYGLNSAALLGLADIAASQVLERAATPPAQGYRFAGFAPHMQDFDPSADHFANMNRCTQEMLLQSGEDEAGSIVLLPAWPCNWDVSFKLWGPLSTSVDVVYANGTLVSLLVDPPARASAVKWANCVTM